MLEGQASDAGGSSHARLILWLAGSAEMQAFEIGRYERKYVISETAAAAIRRFVSAYLWPDQHMSPDEPLGYRVYSLYLDTPEFSLYRHSAEGEKNRFKLRIRFYSTAEDSPAFLEIKKRTGESIHKQRAVVAKPAAEGLLNGRRLSAVDLLSNGESSVRALAEFCDRRERLSASGTAFVSYQREAYVSRLADNVRVTFDRQIAGQGHLASRGLAIPSPLMTVAGDHVVLELKYSGSTPGWMKDLIRTFGLERVSYPKYVHCVDALKLAPTLAG
jgi:VTC domain